MRPKRLKRTLPDYIRPELKILFVGFNPGMRSARIRHQYAGLNNQFWRLLHDAGLVPLLLKAEQDRQVLKYGLGLTNVSDRPTPSCSDLTWEDYERGRKELLSKLLRHRPRAVCFNGKTAYERIACRPCRLGPQRERLAGCRCFVAPSSSAANAAIPYRAKLAHFRRLARWAT